MADATETAAPAATASPQAPQFVDGAKRLKVVPLQWPVEYEGKTWTEITVRRATAGEVANFYESLRSAAQGVKVHFPLYDAPAAVLDALDDDDWAEIEKVTADFLPRRFRADAGNAPTRPAGEVSAQV